MKKRYHFDLGEMGITAWADVDGGYIEDRDIIVPEGTPRWLKRCIEVGYQEDLLIWNMIEAQDRDAEATADDVKYHEDI